MLLETQSSHQRTRAPLNNQKQNQPTSNLDLLADESMADVDEPPDSKPQRAAIDDFCKKSCPLQRQQSLLTRILTTDDSDSNHEDENLFSDARRAHSCASTWSRGSFASTAELTSDGHTSPARTSTPSPPLPPTQFPVAPTFNQKPFDGSLTVKSPPEPVTSLEKTQVSTEQNVEAGLGRKRCITFACGRKDEAKKMEPAKAELPKIEESPKRPSALKFVCPTRDVATVAKPQMRHASPSPRKIPSSPRVPTKAHRGSDSTVRNDSPKSVRKIPSVLRTRKASEDAEVDRNEATRFHEFASSEEEMDDWTQEATCHKNRLTINDTLRVENDLRKLGTEDEEEDVDEEEQLNEEVAQYDEDLDEDDDENMSVGPVPSAGYDSDEGFHSDDEEGFAGSDEETATDSDDDWWAPRRGRGTSAEPVEHIRSTSRLSSRTSSIASMENGQTMPTPIARISSHRRKARSPVKSNAPELPDSTDFVCGTLDEDRPVEQAYLNALRQRQAQKHKPIPQDFDPTFPASDPDMDEEDEESEHDIISDSDNHMFMHGHMDPHVDTVDLRGPTGVIIPRKRSPPVSYSSPRTARQRSPPPTKRVVHRSPPPPTKRIVHRSPPPPTNRRGLLFGQSPTRLRSPPPHTAGPLRSPPPTRRPSLSRMKPLPLSAGLASRPQRPGLASSLPRNGHEYPRKPLHPVSDDEDGDNADTALLTRGAIDIVKGLEKKRQRRREKLLEKHCRLREQGKLKDKADKWKVPRGKGAERMREVGLECAALKGHRRMTWRDEGEGAIHILSY